MVVVGEWTITAMQWWSFVCGVSGVVVHWCGRAVVRFGNGVICLLFAAPRAAPAGARRWTALSN